ncbi:hypothetical protein [Peptostreptococcus porci]|uniref:hypothetical protein n=1 Tax=Peptostreptococcus porci TaxID=2652282 RepID=UPI002A80CB7C|nr:hypothetical protein [Peptostreptococcus porci]MDY4127714.1 hypothetical protein [Peptostreptococcus porci]
MDLKNKCNDRKEHIVFYDDTTILNKLEEYNINLYDENGELKSMSSLLDELSEKWNDGK